MALEISTKNQEKDAKSKALLNKYVSNVVAFTQGKRWVDAKKITKETLKAQDLNGFNIDQVEEQKKAVNKELKQYGLKEKINYIADTNYYEKNSGDLRKNTFNQIWLPTAIAAVAYGVGVATGQPGIEAVSAGIALLGAGNAITHNVLRTAGKPQNAAELAKSEQYADLKHAQMALKKLENALIKKECKEMTQEAYRKGLIPPLVSRGGMGY